MLINSINLMGERFVLPHEVEVDEETMERLYEDTSQTWVTLYLILKAIEPKGVDE